MNMSQLIEELSERTGYHPHDTDRVVRIFFDSIKNAISQKDKVEIRGFGSFNLKNYKGYTGRNPRSGEQVQVKSKKLPVFKTCLLYTSPSPREATLSRMPSSA